MGHPNIVKEIDLIIIFFLELLWINRYIYHHSLIFNNEIYMEKILALGDYLQFSKKERFFRFFLTFTNLNTFENVHQIIAYGILDIFLKNAYDSNDKNSSSAACLDGIFAILKTVKKYNCFKLNTIIQKKILEFDFVKQLTERKIQRNLDDTPRPRTFSEELLDLVEFFL